MMNDEQFELTISDLAGSGTYYADIADELRARDTAQREALARVEAERDRLVKRLCICHECGGRGEVHTGEYTNEGHWQPPEPVMVECGECGGDGQIGQVIDLDTAQAQLAEAVGLLRYAMESSSFREILTLERDIAAFLARHAQAEQQEAGHGHVTPRADGVVMKCGGPGLCAVCTAEQEAQGAQAGDECKRPPEGWTCSRGAGHEGPCAAFEADPLSAEMQALELMGTWTGEDWTEMADRFPALAEQIEGVRRAALATQPAFRKHLIPVSIVTFENAITEEALAAGFNEPDLSRHEVDGCEVYVQQHIQSAYSGWKLALELSPAQQAIDLLVEALVAPNTADLPGRIDSFIDSLPAVRGAEHDQ